ncbi:hypothetical protein CVT26_005962, partial [Gymnopilus dilepis]
DLATDGSLANSTAVLTAPVFAPSHVSSQFLTSNRNELSRPRAASPGVSANRIAATSRPVPPPRRRQAGEPGAKQMASKDLRKNPQQLCGGMKGSEADRIGLRPAQPDNEIEESTTRQRRTGTQGSEETKTTNSVCFGNQDSSGRRFILSSVHGMETKVRDECDKRNKAGINQDVEHEQSDLTSGLESKSKMSLAFGAPNRKKKAASPETEHVYYLQSCPRCSSLGLPCFIPKKSRASKRACWHCTTSRAKCPFTGNASMASGGHDVAVALEDDEGHNSIAQANAELSDEVIEFKSKLIALIDLFKARSHLFGGMVKTFTLHEDNVLKCIEQASYQAILSAVDGAIGHYLRCGLRIDKPQSDFQQLYREENSTVSDAGGQGDRSSNGNGVEPGSVQSMSADISFPVISPPTDGPSLLVQSIPEKNQVNTPTCPLPSGTRLSAKRKMVSQRSISPRSQKMNKLSLKDCITDHFE